MTRQTAVEYEEQNSDLFFVIPRDYVLNTLPRETIEFYGSAGYLDLTKGDLHISREVLRRKNGKILDNISYDEGRTILDRFGLKLPSAALMYKLIIPYIKQVEDPRLANVFRSMVVRYSEFLEDRIKQKKFQETIKDESKFQELVMTSPDEWNVIDIVIGESERRMKLAHRVRETDYRDYHVDGSFNLVDLNMFGFPQTVREDGEFSYFGPNDFNKPVGRELYPHGGGPKGEVVAIRQNGPSLGLNLLFTRYGIQDNLGVRGIRVE